MLVRKAHEIEWVNGRGRAKSPDHYQLHTINLCGDRGYVYHGFVMPWNGSSTKLLLECPKHGKWHSTNFESFCAGRGCPECGRVNRSKRAEASFLINLNKKCENTKYKVVGIVGEFKGGKTKVEFECLEHGKWTTGGAWDYLKRGVSCRKCADKRTADTKRINKIIATKNIENQCIKTNTTFIGFVDGVYVNSSSKLKLKCNTHQTISESTTYKSFISRGIYGCKLCKCESVRISEDVAIAEANALCNAAGYIFHGWCGEYVGTDTKMIIECSHGIKWNTTTLNRFKGKPELSCPCCVTRGYKTTKPGYVYIQKLSGKIDAIKFGISNHDPYIRMRDQKLKSKLTHEIFYSVRFDDGNIPLEIENMIKDKYKGKTRYVPRDLMEDGYTETVAPSELSTIMYIVKSFEKELTA